MKPTAPVVNDSLDQVIRTVATAMGLDISPFDRQFLRKSLDRRLVATGCASVAEYADLVAKQSAEAEAFCQSLCIGYSEFFRNPLTFALLEQQVLPALVTEQEATNRGEIRVWSAGCAAGQEAWSVAMLLDECARKREQPPSYRIFATDLSESDLATARTGVYSADAVSNLRARHLRDYFSRQEDAFSILPRLRANVAFSLYDLLDKRSACPATSIYGDFDLILCCNLLFYYQPEPRQLILDKICHALSPGGYLVTGEAEKEILSQQGCLRAVAPPAAIFQKIRQPHQEQR